MSSRPLLQPMPVIVNGDMTTTLTSLVTIISNISMMSYSYVWTGTAPSGIVTVQVSDDYSQNADGTVKNLGTWNTLPLSITPTVSGATGDGFIDIDQLGAYAIRTVYTPTSGSGTLNVIYKGKVA
jgi:hypothetical protein